MAAGKQMGMQPVLDRVLREIRPGRSEIEATAAVSNEVMGRLKKAVPKSVEIILAGSVARGTQTSGNSDIDIFLLFPRSMDKEAMEKEGMRIAKRVVKRAKGESYVIKYAEHPYLQLIFRDPPVKADIVPAYKIRDSFEMGSSVDRTQLHNLFVMGSLSARQKDDVRLLKAFMRFHGVYGAEAEREGFSGYLCELLVHHYGSFAAALGAFCSMRLPLCIDAKSRKTSGDPQVFKRFGSDFVVIDPTDSNRNVAAVVSKAAMARMVLASRRFEASPSARFFYGAEFSDERSMAKLRRIARETGLDIYFATFRVPDISRDIIFQQLGRLEVRLWKSLRESSFDPVLSLHNSRGREAVVAFFLNRYRITAVARQGPEVFMEKACEAFAKRHGTVYVDGYRMVSVDRAQYGNPAELLRAELADDVPSHLSDARLRVNSVPERIAKLVYRKYMEKTVV